MKTKCGLSKYSKPTPKNFRRLGDGLLGMALFAQGTPVLNDYPTIAVTFFFVGILGKFATNFFTEEN